MGGQEPPRAGGPEALARQSAERLAVALGKLGFDLPRELPMLAGGLDGRGVPGVELGWITTPVADRLATALTRTALRTAAPPEPGPLDRPGPRTRHEPGTGA
jgi:hypothetical protein